MDENYFDGRFFFTNATNDDFVHMWNSEEYTFPKQTMCPMIFAKETLEGIQEIRKRFAYDLAVREYYKSKEYLKNSKMGNGMPPLYDEKVLQPWIDQCLSPLPKSRAQVKEGKVEKTKVSRFSKPVENGTDLIQEFKGGIETPKGAMPDRVTGE